MEIEGGYWAEKVVLGGDSQCGFGRDNRGWVVVGVEQRRCEVGRRRFWRGKRVLGALPQERGSGHPGEDRLCFSAMKYRSTNI